MIERKENNSIDAKLIMGILASNAGSLSRAHEVITKTFGAMDIMSKVVPFDYTHYYNVEMGESILRQYVAFENLISPNELWKIKRRTIELENRERIEGNRTINLDPGYLTLCSVVVASTKEACYRVYLNDGIYAQPMLHYRKNTFVPFEFTYPDYADEKNRIFFNEARVLYQQQKKIGKKTE
jgi:hypothetical protein